MDNCTSVSKFIIKGKSSYVKLDWKNNENELFRITIFDGDHAWTGRFSKEFTRRYMEITNESEEEYCKTVKEALLGNSSNFIYDFSIFAEDATSAQFSWLKTYEDSTTKLKHGSVPVHRSDASETKDAMIEFLIDQNKELRRTVLDYTKKNEDLDTSLEECKGKLEKFVDIKESLEISLYGKFVQLLNDKKKRIKLLEGNLQQFGDTGNDVD